MANGFWSNGTSNQIEISSQNDKCFLVKWDILFLLHIYLYLAITILQPTYLPTNPPTYLDVVPTYQLTHLPKCSTDLPTHSPT
jgi:hypothetical protein